MSQKNYDNPAGDTQENRNSKEQELGRLWPAWKVTPGPRLHAAAYKFRHEKQVCYRGVEVLWRFLCRKINPIEAINS